MNRMVGSVNFEKSSKFPFVCKNSDGIRNEVFITGESNA